MSASRTQYLYLHLEDRVLSSEIHFRKTLRLPNIHGLYPPFQSTEFWGHLQGLHSSQGAKSRWCLWPHVSCFFCISYDSKSLCSCKLLKKKKKEKVLAIENWGFPDIPEYSVLKKTPRNPKTNKKSTPKTKNKWTNKINPKPTIFPFWEGIWQLPHVISLHLFYVDIPV